MKALWSCLFLEFLKTINKLAKLCDTARISFRKQ